LPLTASCGGFGVDHGQKHELGDVTIKGTLDINGPITEGRVLINQSGTDVRIAPNSGAKADIPGPPLRARSGCEHMHSKQRRYAMALSARAISNCGRVR